MGDESRPPQPPATGYPAPPSTGYPTAYPYPNPNPNPNPYPPTYNPNYHPNYIPNRPRLSRTASGILLASAVIIGTIFIILWLVSRPSLPEFRVQGFSVTDFNSSYSGPVLSGKWDVKMVARNGNKRTTMYYDRIQASVFYDHEPLSSTSLPPFVLHAKNETEVRGMFAAADVYVDKWVVDGINKEQAKGTVDFNVRLVAVVRFKSRIWPTRTRWVRVYCKDLGVGLTSAAHNGSLVGGGERRCRVGI